MRRSVLFDWLWVLAAALCLYFYGRALSGLAAQGLILALPWREVLSTAALVHFLRQSLALAVFWLSAHLLGRLCLRALRLQDLDWLWAVGLGAGVMCLLPLIGGLVRLPPREAFRAAAYVLAAADLVLLVPALRGARLPDLGLDRQTVLPAAVAALAAAFALLKALTPVTFFDALVYHLALPDLYLGKGAMVPVPTNPFAGLPANASMLYLWLLSIGDSVSCQLGHWSFGALTAVLLVRLGRRLGDARCGWWAAALFLTTPMVALAASRPAAELVWSFYLALCLRGLLDSGKDSRLLPAAGAAAGLAMGTKYQAVFLLAAAAPLLARSWGGPGLRRSAPFWAAAAAVLAPWLIKNAVHYQDPVYPFLSSGLFPRAWEMDWQGLAGGSHARTPWGVLGSWTGLQDYLAWLGKMSWPWPRNERDNAMSVLYWLLLPRFLWDRSGAAARRGLALGALAGIPLSLCTGIMRYQTATLAPLGLAAGALVPAGASLAHRLGRLALAAGLALHFLFACSSTDGGRAFGALGGGESAVRFLAEPGPGYPCPPYPAYAWFNRHAGPEAKVLIVGEERTFYLERDREAAGLYAREPLAVYLERADSPDRLYRLLRERGFTHLYLNAAAAGRVVADLRLDARKRELLSRFWDGHLREVFRDRPPGLAAERFGLVYALEEKLPPQRNNAAPLLYTLPSPAR